MNEIHIQQATFISEIKNKIRTAQYEALKDCLLPNKLPKNYLNFLMMQSFKRQKAAIWRTQLLLFFFSIKNYSTATTLSSESLSMSLL